MVGELAGDTDGETAGDTAGCMTTPPVAGDPVPGTALPPGRNLTVAIRGRGVRRARQLRKQGHPDGALEVLEELLSGDPDRQDLLYLKAEILLERKDPAVLEPLRALLLKEPQWAGVVEHRWFPQLAEQRSAAIIDQLRALQEERSPQGLFAQYLGTWVLPTDPERQASALQALRTDPDHPLTRRAAVQAFLAARAGATSPAPTGTLFEAVRLVSGAAPAPTGPPRTQWWRRMWHDDLLGSSLGTAALEVQLRNAHPDWVRVLARREPLWLPAALPAVFAWLWAVVVFGDPTVAAVAQAALVTVASAALATGLCLLPVRLARRLPIPGVPCCISALALLLLWFTAFLASVGLLSAQVAPRLTGLLDAVAARLSSPWIGGLVAAVAVMTWLLGVALLVRRTGRWLPYFPVELESALREQIPREAGPRRYPILTLAMIAGAVAPVVVRPGAGTVIPAIVACLLPTLTEPVLRRLLPAQG